MKKTLAGLIAFIAAVTAFVHVAGAPEAAAQRALIGRVDDFYQPADGRIYVLLIGSDARRGNPLRRSASGPDINADGIHLVGLNTETMRGGILNFPRDSWVPVPGMGSRRINDALNRGGPELLARTVQNLTGISIDYWVLTGFEGFQAAVGDLRGVTMNVPTPVVDPGGSGANLRAGRQRLRGFQALAYMRARKPFPGGDGTRTTNHGRFLLALQRKLRAEVSARPASLLRWLTVAQRHTRLNISEEELFRLAILTTQVKPNDVPNVTVPTSGGQVGAAQVLFISPGARSLYDQFRRTATFRGRR